MGYPMASNLRKKIPKGSTLYINDVNTAVVEKFVSEHSSYGPVKIVSSAKEITEKADAIFSIVPKGVHVKMVYLDEKTGVIAAKGSGKDKLFFEMSTIEASITREVGKIIMDAGLGTYFDSPISVPFSLFPPHCLHPDKITNMDYRAACQVPKTRHYHS